MHALARMLLAALCLALAIPCARAEACSGCRSADGAVALCAQHAQAEAQALERLAASVTGDDVAAVRAALDELAALTASHDNAPSPTLARGLALGLEHRTWSVRAQAVRRLLLRRQESLRAGALLDARRKREAHERRGRKLHEAFVALASAQGLVDPPAWDGTPSEAWRAWLERHAADLTERLGPAAADD